MLIKWIGLVISVIPALHQVANFSGFIGVFLGAATYRWLAREECDAVVHNSFHRAIVQKAS